MRIVGFSNLVVDFYLFGGEVSINGGGTVANILSNLAAWGLNTAICGYYGNDALGSFAKNQLSTIGVDVSKLEEKKYATKCFFINEEGTSSTCLFCGKKRRDYRKKTEVDSLEDDDIILIQDFFPLGHFSNRIIWDLGYAPRLHFMAVDELRKIMFRHYFIANIKREVLTQVLKKLNMSLDDFKRLNRIDILIVTDGANGSSVIHSSKEYNFSPKKYNEVDTNGCGDVYFATFIYEVLKKGNLEDVDFEQIQKKAQENVFRVISQVGARAHLTPNVRVTGTEECICRHFKVE